MYEKEINKPTIDSQVKFWSKWVQRSYSWESNPDNARRGASVLEVVAALRQPGLKILDVGCGSGWLSLELAKFGKVTATDLASDILEGLQEKHKHIQWVGGDFLSLNLSEKHFDIVTSLETIAHVPDQKAFAQCIRRTLVPGGTLILTTQNEFIWSRTSWLEPAKPGQIRNWPSRARLRKLFADGFDIKSITTCAPGGNIGIPRLVNNRVSTSIAKMVVGSDRWIRIREQVGLGRSLVLVAVKKK